MAKNKGSPFEQLKGLKSKLAEQEAQQLKRKQIEQKAELQKKQQVTRESDLFAVAMQGVQPLKGKSTERVRVPKPKNLKPTPAGPHPTDDDEVMGELQGMIEGFVPLDFTFSDEFVEGRAMDCSRLELAKLKNGEYAPQAHLDLHGKNRDEAKTEIALFFRDNMAKGNRCVLIICGRGLRSPDRKPVLKELIVEWLAQGALGRSVLAFCSAKAQDGGVGAVYVLLRRRLKG